MLTGEPPQVAPLRWGWSRTLGEGYTRAVVKLEAEPWVPHAAVTTVYRQAQREILAGPNRLLGERSAELARFLAEDGRGLSVREQMRTWNERHPEWAEFDPRNFAAHAKRARRLVTQPGWR